MFPYRLGYCFTFILKITLACFLRIYKNTFIKGYIYAFTKLRKNKQKICASCIRLLNDKYAKSFHLKVKLQKHLPRVGLLEFRKNKYA